jgi:hypothetical protein
MPHWTADDARLIIDGLAVATGALIIRSIGMLVTETYVKPALIWLGRRGYKKADRLTGDRLPNFFPEDR